MTEETRIERILVALDDSTESRGALEAAVVLADVLRAEIEGLFVEDLNLVKLDGLPWAPHLVLPSGTRSPPEAADMEEYMRVIAALTRRHFEAATGKAQVQPTFRVARGRVEAEIIAAARRSDLLVLGWPSRPGRRGRTARAAAEAATGSVLLLPSGTSLARPVLVIYADAARHRALASGLRLAQAMGTELSVLAVGEDGPRADALAADAGAWLAEGGASARVRSLSRADPPRLGSALQDGPESALVIDADSPFANAAIDAARQRGCPLLLVR